MPDRSSFDYAIVRIVPQVEREEFVNAGVILRCRELRFLAAHVELDRARLRALSPGLDLEMVQAELDLIPLVCAGGTGGRPPRRAEPGRAVPLADITAKHHRAGIAGALRPLRRPAGGVGRPLRKMVK